VYTQEKRHLGSTPCGYNLCLTAISKARVRELGERGKYDVYEALKPDNERNKFIIDMYFCQIELEKFIMRLVTSVIFLPKTFFNFL